MFCVNYRWNGRFLQVFCGRFSRFSTSFPYCIIRRLLDIVKHDIMLQAQAKEVRFMQAGKSSIRFEKPPLIAAAASVVGEKEGRGPLGGLF